MMTHEVDFQFEELSPRTQNGRPIEGIMMYGTAVLVSDDCDEDKYSFVVKEVILDGGYTMAKGWLLDQVKAEIYNEKTHIGRAAHEAFRDAVDGYVGDTDTVWKERRERQMPQVYKATEVRV